MHTSQTTKKCLPVFISTKTQTFSNSRKQGACMYMWPSSPSNFSIKLPKQIVIYNSTRWCTIFCPKHIFEFQDFMGNIKLGRKLLLSNSRKIRHYILAGVNARILLSRCFSVKLSLSLRVYYRFSDNIGSVLVNQKTRNGVRKSFSMFNSTDSHRRTWFCKQQL